MRTETHGGISAAVSETLLARAAHARMDVRIEAQAAKLDQAEERRKAEGGMDGCVNMIGAEGAF